MRHLALVCLLVAVAGCDRVPIGPDGGPAAAFTITPDLGDVQPSPDFKVLLSPIQAGDIVSVEIAGRDVPYDSSARGYFYEGRLGRGLNRLPLTVETTGGIQEDTLYAVYFRPSLLSPPGRNAGNPRRNAASTPFGALDRALITGGFDASGSARASAEILQRENDQLSSFTTPLQQARGGHTAVSLANGALLMGGATTDAPSTAGDFVRRPEWVGPSGDSRLVTVADGEGPQRSGHVMRALTLRDTTYLYLLGGRTPGVTASPTVDVYRVDGSAGNTFGLTRLSPEGGASGFGSLLGPTLAEVGVFQSIAFGLNGGEGVSLALQWSTLGATAYPFNLDVESVPGLVVPRRGATAVDLSGGLALIVGGESPQGTLVNTIEVYASEINRSFRFPESALELLVPRADHTATIFGSGRIAIGGGRSTSGATIVSYEIIQL